MWQKQRTAVSVFITEYTINNFTLINMPAEHL